MINREPISYSDVAPEKIPTEALPDPNFVEVLKSDSSQSKVNDIDKISIDYNYNDNGIDNDNDNELMKQYYDDIDNEELEEELEVDESIINHDDIWDDSLLLEAWESANEEYRLLHGDKDWKDNPDYELKSTSELWYNDKTHLGNKALKQSKNSKKKRKRSNKVASNGNNGDDSNKKGKLDELSQQQQQAQQDQQQQQQDQPLSTSIPTSISLPFTSDYQQQPSQDYSKEYILQQLSQSWYSAGYWTGILQQKFNSNDSNNNP